MAETKRRRHQQSSSALDRVTARLAGARLEEWYADHRRQFSWRAFHDPYKVLVAEILLQRTRADVVERFLPLFLERYPAWQDLRHATADDLERLLSEIGLQRRRAQVFKSLADCLSTHDSVDIDCSLPGVGQYVERAVRVSLANESVAMVDSNFVRIILRVFRGPWMADYRTDRRLQELASAVVAGGTNPQATNWAVLDLGALVCRPASPACRLCPLRGMCSTAAGRQLGSSRLDPLLVDLPPDGP